MAVGLRRWVGDGEASEWGIWARRRSQADSRLSRWAGRVGLVLGWAGLEALPIQANKVEGID
jgi:hypothetical protein